MTNSDWWRGAVVYQIYPRSFADSNNDGLGDLNGITSKLDHVASLGVDAIWLSPIFTSPMKDMGYDVSDYCNIDPIFGTLQDFDALIVRAHELGLKVIIDQVLSHSSDTHDFFTESRKSRDNPKADWYVWADPKPDGSPPNNWPSVFGGPAWEWEPRRRQYYLHNFLIEQPDLNMHNPDVQDWLLGTMRFWLERGVDGFRLDTVNYYFHDAQLRDNPPRDNLDDLPAETYGWQKHVHSKNQPENIPFLKKMRALTDEFDARMMVGEVGDAGITGMKIMGEYTEGNDLLHMCYNFEMLGQNFSARHFRETIETFQTHAPDGWPSWSFSNHDVQRHVSRWSEYASSPEKLAKLAIAMLASFEGTLGIYQGEELALPEAELVYSELTDPPGLRFWPEVKGRDGCRTPMVWNSTAENGGFSRSTPWLPVKQPHLERALNLCEAENDGVLQAYRETLAFRQNTPALRSGRTEFIDIEEPILALRRIEKDQAITCIFNLSKQSKALHLTTSVEIVGPHAADLSGTSLTLPANGFVYLASGAVDISLV